MGIAEATAFIEALVLSRGGDGDMPAGEAMDAGNMKSSRFIGSAGGTFV